MSGIDLFAAAGLFLLAANPVECRVPKAPLVEVIPKTAPTAYDYTKSVADLQRMKSDTISPYGRHEEQLVYGLHRGKMSIGYSIEFGGVGYPDYDLACLYFNKVTVTLELNPVIYVAKEFRPGTCAHKAVLDHEKKHVATDRRIANKYARVIGLSVQKAVNESGAIGPYYTEEIPVIREKMSRHIGKNVESVEFLMLEEQNRMQQEVDSMEEYDSVSEEIHGRCGVKPERYR